jgi:adenosylhomocysteine nucleosidase
MIGRVYAMEEEAKEIIHTSSLEKNQPFQVYQKDAMVLIISQIGKVYAALATDYLLHHYPLDVIINIGLAGKINPVLHTGDVFLVRAVTQHDIDIPDDFCPAYLKVSIPCFIPVSMNKVKTVFLVTGDQLVRDPETVRRLVSMGDIVDMDGYSVALTAKLYSIPCILIKGISDDADAQDIDAMMQNVHVVMQKSIAVVNMIKNMYEKN